MNHLSTSPESLCHPDYLGSIEWVTNADGRPVEYFWYSPWGETLKADNSWRGRFSSPFKFTGHIEDEETGLTYAGARYYPARESQWLSVDPLAEKYPSLTPYNYVANNPVNLVDPDGRKIKWNLSAVVVCFAMSFSKTGRENIRAMRKDKGITHHIRISFAVGMSKDENGNFHLVSGFQTQKDGDPCAMLTTIYLGTYKISKLNKGDKRWSELSTDIQERRIKTYVLNRNKKVEFTEDSGGDTGKKHILDNSFFENNRYISGADRNYIDYSPKNESMFNYIERIGIHETTHALVESGKWLDKDIDFRKNNPGSDVESYPQERERLWKIEKDK